MAALVILAWLMLCVAVSGAIWLVLNWPRHNRIDPMQDASGDIPKLPTVFQPRGD